MTSFSDKNTRLHLAKAKEQPLRLFFAWRLFSLIQKTSSKSLLDTFVRNYQGICGLQKIIFDSKTMHKKRYKNRIVCKCIYNFIYVDVIKQRHSWSGRKAVKGFQNIQEEGVKTTILAQLSKGFMYILPDLINHYQVKVIFLKTLVKKPFLILEPSIWLN